MMIYDYFLEKFGKLNQSEKRLLNYLDSPNFAFEDIKLLLKKADLSTGSFYNFLQKNHMASYKDLYAFVRSINSMNDIALIFEKSYIYKKYLQVINRQYIDWLGTKLIDFAKMISQAKEIIIYASDEILADVATYEMSKLKKQIRRYLILVRALYDVQTSEDFLFIVIDHNQKIDLTKITKQFNLSPNNFVYLGAQQSEQFVSLNLFDNQNAAISTLHHLIFCFDLLRHAYSYLVDPKQNKTQVKHFNFYQQMINNP